MDIHIGQEIERRFQESGLKIGVFADRINTGERNVYSLFKRKDVSIQQLQQIGEVLNFDIHDIIPSTSNSSKTVKENIPEFIGKYQLTFGISNESIHKFKEFNDEMAVLAKKYKMTII